jgi:KDO2-lipid IV(A) lauroyltransferase
MAVMRSMSLEQSSRFSARLWCALAPHLYRHKRAMNHLAMAFPDKSEAECREIAMEMWSTLGATFAESFHLDQIARETDRMAISASDSAAKAMAEHHGLVMVSLHMGNWEINALAAQHQGLRLAGVYQRIKNPLVDEMIRALRVDYYPKGLFSKGHEAVKGLMRVVGEGDTVALLADVREGRGLAVPFFGRPAPSNPFPALLARGRKLPLVAARVLRQSAGRYTIHCELIDVPQTDNREADILAATTNIQSQFETWIRETPGQWMWGHRRWG